MNSVKSNNQSLKYQTSGSKDIAVYIFDFVTKTQFLICSSVDVAQLYPNQNFPLLDIFHC